jgi:hypothetical protein
MSHPRDPRQHRPPTDPHAPRRSAVGIALAAAVPVAALAAAAWPVLVAAVVAAATAAVALGLVVARDAPRRLSVSVPVVGLRVDVEVGVRPAGR